MLLLGGGRGQADALRHWPLQAGWNELRAVRVRLEAHEPFRILGLSDPFCWPGDTMAPTSTLDSDARCPFVTMTMSVQEIPHRPDHVLVAYGANDCHSRFV